MTITVILAWRTSYTVFHEPETRPVMEDVGSRGDHAGDSGGRGRGRLAGNAAGAPGCFFGLIDALGGVHLDAHDAA